MTNFKGGHDTEKEYRYKYFALQNVHLLSDFVTLNLSKNATLQYNYLSAKTLYNISIYCMKQLYNRVKLSEN
jgi:hypothetical protein